MRMNTFLAALDALPGVRTSIHAGGRDLFEGIFTKGTPAPPANATICVYRYPDFQSFRFEGETLVESWCSAHGEVIGKELGVTIVPHNLFAHLPPPAPRQPGLRKPVNVNPAPVAASQPPTRSAAQRAASTGDLSAALNNQSKE